MAKLNKVLKQAQQMQAKMLQMQDELGNLMIEGTAGGGMVVVKYNGKSDIVDVKIDPDAIDPDDVEMLEDLIMAAINDGKDKVNKTVEDRMGSITGGIDIPGLSDLF